MAKTPPVETVEGVRALLLEGRSVIRLAPALSMAGVRETAVVQIDRATRSIMIVSPLEGTLAEKRADVLRQLADMLDPRSLENR